MLEWTHDDRDDALTPTIDQGQTLHVLLPATGPDVNLCKTSMGLRVLGYPEPVLLGYNKDYPSGGQQIDAKITQALAYVKTLEDDEDLVLMVDAYDSWFQLPPAVLRTRYFATVTAASHRMRRRLGRRAVRREAMKQSIVFGARKTCAPNLPYSIACYPVPEATTPRDMYGASTDTILGANKHSSFRPRYLDAGLMMGPVGDVRAMLERAAQIVEELPKTDMLDDYASKSHKNLWEDDAQGVFARIFGEQAFQREIIRLRYRSWFKKWSLPHTPGSSEGHGFKDITNPPFTHEDMQPLDGHPREFGINLDFSGILVSNTATAENDHRNVLLDGRPQEEFAKSIENRQPFDCSVRLKSVLPADLQNADVPDNIDHKKSWAETRLFGNLCLGNAPVVLHHNGAKNLRELAWPDVWWQNRLRERLHNSKNAEDHGAGGYTQAKEWMIWEHLCPRSADKEIFRDP